MTDENFVLDQHALTNEGVTGDLAPVTDTCPFLDFDERADFHVIADLASIQVGESENLHSLTESNVGSNSLI
jgi:hypothetical protein